MLRSAFVLTPIAICLVSLGCAPPPSMKTMSGPGGGGSVGIAGAKPRAIVGTATFPDGRPIPTFHVTTEGGGMDLGGKCEGKDGRYELDVTDSSMVVVFNVDASVPVTLNGQPYDFPLDPVDGLPSYPHTDGFKGDLTTGVVRNFVFHLTGVRPDDKNDAPQETDLDDKGNGKFFGGDIDVELSEWPQNDCPVQLDLTPTGPLIDGSAGQPITRKIVIPKGSYHVYVHDIPLGAYTATVQVDGAPKMVTMHDFGTPLETTTPASSVAIQWVPQGNGLAHPTVKVQL